MLGTLRAEETGRDHPFTRFLAGLRQSETVRGNSARAFGRRRKRPNWRAWNPRPPDERQPGEIFRATRGNPLFVLESVRAGLQSTRVHAVIAARLAQLSPAILRTGRTGERHRQALLLRIAGEGHGLGRSQCFPRPRRTLAAAHHRKPRRRGVRFHARPPARSGLRGTEPGAPTLLAPPRGTCPGRGISGPISKVWNGQIASHYEQAGMAEEAIGHYQRAAAYARQRYADTEVADLLRRALALCRGFPESDRRRNQELDLAGDPGTGAGGDGRLFRGRKWARRTSARWIFPGSWATAIFS